MVDNCKAAATQRAAGERVASFEACLFIQRAMKHLRKGDAEAAARSLSRSYVWSYRRLQSAEDDLEALGFTRHRDTPSRPRIVSRRKKAVDNG